MKRYLCFVLALAFIVTAFYSSYNAPSITATSFTASTKNQTFKEVKQDYLITNNNDLYFLPSEGNYIDGYDIIPKKILSDVVKYKQIDRSDYSYAVTKNGKAYVYRYLNEKPIIVYSSTKDVIFKYLFGDDTNGNMQFYVIKNDNTLWETELNTLKLKNKIATNVKSVYQSYYWDDGGDHIDINDINTLILKKDNSLWGRGTNKSGELGFGDNKKRTKFSKIMTDVGSMYYNFHRCFYVIKKDKSLWTWSGKAKPHKILSNVKSIVGTHIRDIIRFPYEYALDFKGKLWRIDNNKISVFATNVKQFSGDYYGEYLIKNDNSLWRWGDFPGDGSEYSDKPIKILTNVRSYTYNRFNKALRYDNTLWCWGKDMKINKKYSNVKQVLTNGVLSNKGYYIVDYDIDNGKDIKRLVSQNVSHVFDFVYRNVHYFTKSNESGLWQYDVSRDKIQKFFQ